VVGIGGIYPSRLRGRLTFRSEAAAARTPVRTPARGRHILRAPGPSRC